MYLTRNDPFDPDEEAKQNKVFCQAKVIVENDTFQDFQDDNDKGLMSHFNLNELLEDSPMKESDLTMESDFARDAKKRRVNKNVSKDPANIQNRATSFPDENSDEKKKKMEMMMVVVKSN